MMASYELRNQQTGEVIAEVQGGISFVLRDAYSLLDADCPVAVWEVFAAERSFPMYLCTLIMNSDPKLDEL